MDRRGRARRESTGSPDGHAPAMPAAASLTARPSDCPDHPRMHASNATPAARIADPFRARRALAAERRIARAAYLLDDLVPIPGIGSRIGLDPVLGLVPFLGDAMTAFM